MTTRNTTQVDLTKLPRCSACDKEQPEGCFECPTCPVSKEQLSRELREKKERLQQLVFRRIETCRPAAFVKKKYETHVFIYPRKFDRTIAEQFFQCFSFDKLPEKVRQSIVQGTGPFGIIREKPSFIFMLGKGGDPHFCHECGTLLEWDGSAFRPRCPECAVERDTYATKYAAENGVTEGGF